MSLTTRSSKGSPLTAQEMDNNLIYLQNLHTFDLIPSQDNTYVLGTSASRWKSLSLGQGTLFITDVSNPSIQAAITVNNGSLQINGAAQLQLGNITLTPTGISSASSSQNITIGNTGDTGYLSTARGIQFPDNSLQTTAWIPSYGSFESSATQSNLGITYSNLVTFNTITTTNGITLGTSSQIIYNNSGTYVIDFNGLFFFSGGASNYNITIWYSKNNVIVPSSAYTFTTTSAQGDQVMGHITDLVILNAGDYIQIYWWAGASGIKLQPTSASTNPTRPSSSSATYNTWRVG
jgi:hypothetical protein